MSHIAPSVDSSIRPILAMSLEALEKSRWFLNKLLDGLTDEQRMLRACPGMNHAVWIVGHIAWTEDYFLSRCAGRPSGLPEGWEALFQYGSEVSDDPGVYPAHEELMRVLQDRRDALIGWLFTMDEVAMTRPLEGDLAELSKNFGQVSPFLAFHEGFHAGQLSAARRAAGLERLF